MNHAAAFLHKIEEKVYPERSAAKSKDQTRLNRARGLPGAHQRAVAAIGPMAEGATRPDRGESRFLKIDPE
jgi:hypothetical protein